MQDTEKTIDTEYIPENPELNHAITLMLEKKAQDVVVVDLREFTQLFDFAIIASGLSSTQLDVIRRTLERGLRKIGTRPLGTEGTPQSGWILLDYVDFVIHVFSKEKREYYRLEKLWGDMPSTTIEDNSEL